MRLSSVVATLTALAVLVGIAPVCSACSCAPPSDFHTAYAGSDAVFLGEVVEVSSAAPDRPLEVWVTIRVEADWKGAPPTTTRMLTAANDAACGVSFIPGTRYLVYPSSGTKTPLWAAPPPACCGPTGARAPTRRGPTIRI